MHFGLKKTKIHYVSGYFKTFLLEFAGSGCSRSLKTFLCNYFKEMYFKESDHAVWIESGA
jgi:hypothetical protein